MASQIQRIEYEGFLAADPETGYTKNNKRVTNFRMGSNYNYKTGDGEQRKETTWIKVTCWGSLGEIVSQYCGKGSHVIVFGRLRVGENGSPSVYQLSTGEYAASYEIVASDVRILKGKDTNGGSSPAASDNDNDDIPF